MFILKKLLIKQKNQKVAAYYDSTTPVYVNSGYGEVIQAHRPADASPMLDMIISHSGISDGMTVLDAGCGIGGPAAYFAEKLSVHITGVTNSPVQFQMAQELIKKHDLKGSVDFVLNDYHFLSSYLPQNHFDLVLMLESYGHHIHSRTLLRAVASVLKKGGALYIKDYFKKPLPPSPAEKAIFKRLTSRMNHYYSYNLPDLCATINGLRNEGLELEFVRKNDILVGTQDFIKKFEETLGIDIFEGRGQYRFVEPLELLFRKPEAPNAPIP